MVVPKSDGPRVGNCESMAVPKPDGPRDGDCMQTKGENFGVGAVFKINAVVIGSGNNL